MPVRDAPRPSDVPAHDGPLDVGLLRRRLESLIGVPCTEGNAVRRLRNGDEIFAAMLDAIKAAEHTVDFLTYVYWTGRPAHWFADALSERAAAGVEVRVLIDAVGGLKMGPDLVEQMTAAGVTFEKFRPPWLRSPFTHNHRTHRKVLVVDETVAFTGGVGIAEEWCGDARNEDEWRDTHLEIRGPAVAGLQAAFVQNWGETNRPLDTPAMRFPVATQAGTALVQVVRGSATVGWDDIESAWWTLLGAAQSRIRLQTAYFAPDRDFRRLLNDAAGRGVQVQVLVPGMNADKLVSRVASERSFEPLLEAGVEVWRFLPTMLHTKVLVVDDVAAMVGSANFNRRSLDHDEEVVAVIVDDPVVARLAADFDEDLARAEQVTAQEWATRGLPQRALEAAVGPLRRFL